MSSPFEDTPEDLVALQTTVRDWVEKAQKAVLSFRRTDGSFWRGSDALEAAEEKPSQDKRSLTTTSRSYIALAYADRCLSKGENTKSPDWIASFNDFFAKPVLKSTRTGLKEIPLTGGMKDPKNLKVNYFDVAHLADLKFTQDYVNRFLNGDLLDLNTLLEGQSTNLEIKTKKLTRAAIKEGSGKDKKKIGQSSLGPDEPLSDHFFITLHSLRAFSIWNPEEIEHVESDVSTICKSARQFCAEQCFYSQRGILHKQDTIRLAFAGVIYCLYAKEVDKELLLAVVEALDAAQRENGSWLATHPIIRNKNKPWHITSHEIALCLTWLHFQPRIPDAARPLLLGMMERYFVNWVVPTFIRVPVKLKEKNKWVPTKPDDTSKIHEFMGWYDDHTITDDFAVGWATAIVCHFLANYHAVLDDHINRRVIETIGLAPFSKRYLIDEDSHESSFRWQNSRDSDSGNFLGGERPSVTWPDLPPFAWCDERDPGDLKSEIEWQWTDSSPGAEISDKLETEILLPIFESRNGRPKPKLCAGMLPGPPGTRKTSLVKALSKMLQWPLISVPASVMFDKGFDMLETRATEVFHHLNYLTGCVIFFDEFEEFFRQRPQASAGVENKDSFHDRTIAAFTTSAMLPRLQELHDEGRCLIFLATNHPDEIDMAVRRLGRFDFFLEIMHPNQRRILEYLEGETTQRTIEMLGFRADASNNHVDDSDEVAFKELTGSVHSVVKKERSKKQYRFAWIEEALLVERERDKLVEGEVDNASTVLAKRRHEACMTERTEKKKGKKPYKKFKGPPPPLLSP